MYTWNFGVLLFFIAIGWLCFMIRRSFDCLDEFVERTKKKKKVVKNTSFYTIIKWKERTRFVFINLQKCRTERERNRLTGVYVCSSMFFLLTPIISYVYVCALKTRVRVRHKQQSSDYDETSIFLPIWISVLTFHHVTIIDTYTSS